MSTGLKGIRSIEELELEGKNVFLRVDFNVPMKDGVITDDKRGLQVFYRLQTPCVLNVFECVRQVQDERQNHRNKSLPRLRFSL